MPLVCGTKVNKVIVEISNLYGEKKIIEDYSCILRIRLSAVNAPPVPGNTQLRK